MNIHRACLLALAAAMLARASTVAAAPSHNLAVGVLQHKEHSAFEMLPFVDDDLGYGLAYEYREAGSAYWQFGAWYTDSPGEGKWEQDYAVTPQINLIFEDRAFRAGFGALATYLAGNEFLETAWTDLYWHFILGLGIPLGPSFRLEVSAYYAFEAFDELSDFEWDDIEFGAWLSHSF